MGGGGRTNKPLSKRHAVICLNHPHKVTEKGEGGGRMLQRMAECIFALGFYLLKRKEPSEGRESIPKYVFFLKVINYIRQFRIPGFSVSGVWPQRICIKTLNLKVCVYVWSVYGRLQWEFFGLLSCIKKGFWWEEERGRLGGGFFLLHINICTKREGGGE